jgi:hypothetical protein
MDSHLQAQRQIEVMADGDARDRDRLGHPSNSESE